MGARFSVPVQTGPGAHPASCTMGTGSFLGVKRGRGVTPTPHSLLVPWSRKSRAISLYLYSSYVAYGLSRASVPVQWCTLPFTLQQIYSTSSFVGFFSLWGQIIQLHHQIRSDNQISILRSSSAQDGESIFASITMSLDVY